jgi:hypothetical protein
MDLKEIGCGCEWVQLSQDRAKWQCLMNTVMNLWVP